MAVNEIRVVLTGEQGESLTGQNQSQRSSINGSLATGALLGAGTRQLSPVMSSSDVGPIGLNNTFRAQQRGLAWRNITKNFKPGDLRLDRMAGVQMGLANLGPSSDSMIGKAGMAGARYVKGMLSGNVRAYAGTITTGLQIANLTWDIKQHNASIAGNTHKAAILSNKQNLVNDLSGVAIATAINPMAGIGMLAMTAYRKVMQHDQYINDMKIQSSESAYYRERIARTITSGRVSV
jgi:hypothetical protein